MTNLEIAKQRYEAWTQATIAELFNGGPPVNDADFGYRHGWFTVNGESFNVDMITGIPYDHTQGGWAYL